MSPSPALFQSLRGFGVGWSANYGHSSPYRSSFQSLRGFGVGWSPDSEIRRQAFMPVSIPERVWGGLERGVPRLTRPAISVSIPERVWGGLEPLMKISHKHILKAVSIPERVWGGLERSYGARPGILGHRFNP